MDIQEIKVFTINLEDSIDENEAQFGFYLFGSEADEGFIGANRQGLKLYAVQLLKAVIEAETFANEDDKEISVEFDWIDTTGHFVTQYIKILNNKSTKGGHYESSWKDKIYTLGCVGIGLLLVAIILIGLGTILSWFQ